MCAPPYAAPPPCLPPQPPVHLSCTDAFALQALCDASTVAAAVRRAPTPSVMSGPTVLAGTNVVPPHSHYRGVTWDAGTKAWRSTIKINRKLWYLGIQRQELAAAKAYDVACWFLTGSKVKLNFVEVDYDLAELPRRPPPWLEKYLLEEFEWDKSHAKHSTELFKRWLAAVSRRGLEAPPAEGLALQVAGFHSLETEFPPAKQLRRDPNAARAAAAAATWTPG
jgi:hypothetical protein